MVIFAVIFAIFFCGIKKTGNSYFIPKSTFIKLYDILFAVLSFKMARIRIFSRRTQEDTAKVRSNLNIYLRMSNENAEDTLKQEEIVWFAVCVTEVIAIFVINAVTIIAFARNHHLRKRSTYLIINLTVADLLMGGGGVRGPLELYLAKIDPGPGFCWQKNSILICLNIFPVCSLTNLSLIALERLHATLYPFRHCLIRERVYFKIIICSWLLALTLSSLLAVADVYEPITYWYVWTSHIVLTLLLLTISYVTIMLNVKRNPPPHHFAPVVSDRKLSVTLFIVTIVSILTVFPFAIYAVVKAAKWNQLLSKTAQCHIFLCSLCALLRQFFSQFTDICHKNERV